MNLRNLTLLLLACAMSALSFAAEPKVLPRLLDVGSGKCIPCRKMKPVLDELKREYTGKLNVVFIDLYEERNAADAYAVRIIPTQIFFSPEGKELYRHEGYMSKKAIIEQWKALGYPLSESRDSK